MIIRMAGMLVIFKQLCRFISQIYGANGECIHISSRKAYIRMSSKGQGFILRCNMEFDCLHVFPVDYIHDTLFTREMQKCS